MMKRCLAMGVQNVKYPIRPPRLEDPRAIAVGADNLPLAGCIYFIKKPLHGAYGVQDP